MPTQENYLFERYNAADLRHQALGDQLEAMRAAEKPTMLPLGSEVMAGHTTGVIVSHNDIAVGYNGVIFEYNDGIAEMGGLYINPTYRGQGLTRAIKAELFPAIKGIDRIKKVITFANRSSLQLNLNLGFKPASPEDIPGDSLANCAGCPDVCLAKSAGKMCCDTILIIDVDELPDLGHQTGTRA